jgi:branched-chain amino acid transport system permease protein
MEELLQYTFNGLGKGAIYASLALALVIVFRTTGLVNFAQGEMAMFSTFIIWWLAEDAYDLPLWLATIIAMGLSFVGAALIERFLVRPVGSARHNPLAVVIVTIGLFLAFNALAPWLWGTSSKPGIPVATGAVTILGASMSKQSLAALVILAVEVGLLWLLFQKTKIGLAMRGVASNAESSALVGVPVGRMLMIGWGLAAAIGAVAGLLSADIGVDASIMQVPLIYAFAAATLGGFDSPLGAVVGGLVVGLVSELSAAYIDWIGQDLRLLPAFVLILGVLMIRPQGLFGKAEVSRV